jgi:curved DNA-binding protein CbpA
VHPDAHPTVIRERYMALSNKSDLPHDLLDEAYFVLNNPQKRVEYDRLLKRYKHAIAVKKMQMETDELNKDIRLRSDSFASSKIIPGMNSITIPAGCHKFPDLSPGKSLP